MFVLPGIISLLVFLYARPQEYFEILQRVPFLYLALAFALLGFAVDLRLRITVPKMTPHLVASILLFLWGAVTVVIKAPQFAFDVIIEFGVPLATYLVIAHAVQTFRSLQVVTGVLLAIGLFLAFVGVHQRHADWGCVLIDPHGTGSIQEGTPDGRSCLTRDECMKGEAEPGKEYHCERVGIFGTSSTDSGRVRYRGILQDPNELALAIGITLPFAFAFASLSRRRRYKLLLIVSFVLIMVCTMYTRSRSGQLVVLAGIGVYFVNRYGWRGMVAGAALALPVLLLGGRGGDEASMSTFERYEAWLQGIDLLRLSPVIGIGMGQYTEYHYITAHNSAILVATELGLPGFFLWSVVLYLALKTTVVGFFRYSRRPEGAVARAWGLALIASFAGMLAGCFFLSMSYHPVFWIYIGLTGAYYNAVRRHDPTWKISIGIIEMIGLVIIDLAFLVAMLFYLRLVYT